MPPLETERLILRDFVLTDWDALNAIVSDPSVTRFMHFAFWDEAKRREWFTRLVQNAGNPHSDAYNWAITLKSNGMLIGWLFIGGTSRPSEAGCGYALNQHFWGQGYMLETLRVVIAYEFSVLGTCRITAECETQNTASARVMQKSGMVSEGTFYEPDFEGNWAQRHHYAISKQDGDSRRLIVGRQKTFSPKRLLMSEVAGLPESIAACPKEHYLQGITVHFLKAVNDDASTVSTLLPGTCASG